MCSSNKNVKHGDEASGDISQQSRRVSPGSQRTEFLMFFLLEAQTERKSYTETTGWSSSRSTQLSANHRDKYLSTMFHIFKKEWKEIVLSLEPQLGWGSHCGKHASQGLPLHTHYILAASYISEL